MDFPLYKGNLVSEDGTMALIVVEMLQFGNDAALYKQFDSLSVEGAKEIEVQVSDFDKTVQLLQQVGLDYRSLQESRRENWRVGNVEVMLDEWPWLKPYAEIEGESEAGLKDMAEITSLWCPVSNNIPLRSPGSSALRSVKSLRFAKRCSLAARIVLRTWY